MGLLKSIFGQNPEKHEQKGDACVNAADWGRAKLAYEDALDTLKKTSPGDARMEARLQGKLRRSMEALALEHRKTGEDLMETEYYDEARELFQLGMELTRDPELITSFEKRLEETDRLIAEPEHGEPVYLEPAIQNDDEAVPGETEDETFMALCGTLPDDIRAAYASYGEAFKSGYLALNRGDFDLAAGDLSRAMEGNPSPESFVPLELATACLNLGRLDEARRLLETFLAHHPDALPGYQTLCEVLWELKDFEQAEVLLAQCPEELKSSLAYYLLKGETFSQAGRHSEAASLYEAFMEEHGRNEPVAAALARTYETLGDLEKSRDIYAEIMDQCRSCHTRIDPLIKRKFADISFDLGEHSSAVLETYLSLAQEDALNAPFYYQRISLLFSSLGNEEEARRFRSFARQAETEKG